MAGRWAGWWSIRAGCRPAERKALTRRYTTEIGVLIGPDRDIPTPDVNTGSQTMAWIMDTYSMQHGHTIPAVVTGKPQAIGGTRGRREAISRGAFRCILAAARCRNLELKGARVALQGFGRVGTVLAEMLADAGATLVALADDREAVANPAGIDAAAAIAHMRKQDTVRDLAGAERDRSVRPSSASTATCSSPPASSTRSTRPPLSSCGPAS